MNILYVCARMSSCEDRKHPKLVVPIAARSRWAGAWLAGGVWVVRGWSVDRLPTTAPCGSPWVPGRGCKLLLLLVLLSSPSLPAVRGGGTSVLGCIAWFTECKSTMQGGSTFTGPVFPPTRPDFTGRVFPPAGWVGGGPTGCVAANPAACQPVSWSKPRPDTVTQSAQVSAACAVWEVA